MMARNNSVGSLGSKDKVFEYDELNNNITISYIDDDFDIELSKYLDRFCKFNKYTYYSITFKASDGFEKNILENKKILESDIVFIDSQLYSESDSPSIRGESLLLLLQEKFPFKKLFIVSQVTTEFQNDKYGIIKKFDSSSNESRESYHDRIIKKVLDCAIDECKIDKNRIESMDMLDEVTLTRIRENYKGIEKYSKLNSEDIDRLVNSFKELESKIHQ